MPKAITEKLADFVLSVKFEDLPLKVVEMAKACFLDWLGSAIAGSRERPVRIMMTVSGELGGKPEATLIPDGSRSSCLLAAMVNSSSSHVIEMDDLHQASILHPGAVVIPASLAVAEREGSSGGELIASIVAGYEVAIRIGEAAGPSHYRYWHTTGTCGTFGAAAAAGKLLGLEKREMVWALGNSGTQSSGLWEFLKEGAMSKQLHIARASESGLLAALLAQMGFTGTSQILEGEKGFLRAMAPEGDPSILTAGLGKAEYRIMSTSLKAHASCYHTHSAIDATIELLRKYQLKSGDVRRLLVRLYSGALDLLEKVEPSSPYAAKFSLPFCVATAFIYGDVGLEAFNEERLKDPKINETMKKVELKRDKELDRLYPEMWPAIVEVTLKSGDVLRARVDNPRGSPLNPMGKDEVIGKFRRLTEGMMPKERRESLLEKCLHLEEIPSMASFYD